MADHQFRALSSCLVIVFLVVIEKGKFIVLTQLIYELN